MTDLNKHGEHPNDMDYIIELQAEIKFLSSMCGSANSALAVYRNHLECEGELVLLGEIDAKLQALDIDQNAHATLKAQAELLEELIAKIDNFEKQRKGNPQQCLLDFAWNEVIEAYTKAE